MIGGVNGESKIKRLFSNSCEPVARVEDIRSRLWSTAVISSGSGRGEREGVIERR